MCVGKRQYNTKRYNEKVVKETMNKLPADIAWVLQSIIAATNKEDVVNVVDAFVTGVKSVTERVMEEDNDVSAEVRNAWAVTQNKQEKQVESNEGGNARPLYYDDKYNSGVLGSISGNMLCDRDYTEHKNKRAIIAPYVGAEAIVAGMQGAPELNISLQRSILTFDFDTSDIHSILYLGTVKYISDESRERVFRGAKTEKEIKGIVSQYNQIIKTKLSKVPCEPLAYKLYAIVNDDKNKSILSVVSVLDNYACFIDVFCNLVRHIKLVDYVIYSTGSALKAKGIDRDGNFIAVNLRYVLEDEGLQDSDITTIIKRNTKGIKMPKIVDALK